VNIKVYDMIGNIVHAETTSLNKGINKFSLNMNYLADGNYSAVITFDGQDVVVKKIIVQK
jgi:hypothetical protein